MPTRIYVNILQARSLPVMDRTSGLTDAYVKPQLKGVTFDPTQTQTAKKTLNPVWHEQFKCDVTDDCLLQDEPLQLRLFDYDVLSADDVIGTVYVHCNSLYEGERSSGDKQKRQIHGWYPIYDTLRGICGELQVTVYIQHIMDFNPVEDSSVGVQVLSASIPPDCYVISELHGLVDELIVEDDPEYDWQDNFRSSRSSNDARQLLFHVMDGKLRRQIGRKVTDCGGNALLGYQTHFDLEDNYIIARGIGTAVTLQESAVVQKALAMKHEKDNGAENSEQDGEGTLVAAASLDESDVHLTRSPQQVAAILGTGQAEETYPSLKELEPLTQAQLRTLHRSKREHFRANLRLQEVQVFSMSDFPPGILLHFGGMVAARSVKVIGQDWKQERVIEARDAWWSELREEIKNHARSLDCCDVVGYSEHAAISEDGVCVLSASGTAAILDTAALSARRQLNPQAMSPTTEEMPHPNSNGHSRYVNNLDASRSKKSSPCGVCHIPYSHRSPPFSMRLVLCNICGRKYVPDVLLTTIEMPETLATEGQGELLEVHVCRARPTEKKGQGAELSASRLSESIPFMEYDLHKQIMLKLKIRSHNAVFGLRTQLCVGENLVTCIATGTSVLLSALPVPQPLAIRSSEGLIRESRLMSGAGDIAPDHGVTDAVLNHLVDVSETNRGQALKQRESAVDDRRQAHGSTSGSTESAPPPDIADESSSSDSDTSSDDSTDAAPRPAYVLEIDDEQGFNDLMALWEDPVGFELGVYSTARIPTATDATSDKLGNMRLLTLFRRVSLQTTQRYHGATLAALYQEMLFSLSFRLRNYPGPHVLCGVKTQLSLPEENMLQIGLVAMSLGPSTATTEAPLTRTSSKGLEKEEKTADEGEGPDDMESSARRRHAMEDTTTRGDGKPLLVEVTPLSYIPGARIATHVDRVMVCMIREVLKMNEEGNLSIWTSRLLLEGQAMVRAQAAAMGCNAVTHYNVEHMIINNVAHKMRVYSILMMTGDAVRTTSAAS